MPTHVGHKIASGATRNLIIRSTHSEITPQRVRDDLEHIHNLVVVDLTVTHNRDMLISLNSVNNALFARTCMMSRGRYKGMKIEFYADECAESLPTPQLTPKKANATPESSKNTTMANRFQMLNMDGTEDGSADEDSDDIPDFTKPAKWTTSAVAV